MRCLLVVLAIVSPSLAAADIVIDVEVDVRPPSPPPAPPSEPREPEPPAQNLGWDKTNRVAISLATAATAVFGTGERGRGVGGAVTFHATGAFFLDMSIEVLHQQLEMRSITQVNYALHVVNRQKARQRVHPFLVFALGVGVESARREAEVQGLLGIGAGLRFRLTEHIVPSLEVRALHRIADPEHGLPSENLADVRAGVMYLF